MLRLTATIRLALFLALARADKPTPQDFTAVALASMPPQPVVEPGALDENGEPIEGAVKVPDNVDYARFVVPLMKVVQGLVEKNAALEARLAALEGTA